MGLLGKFQQELTDTGSGDNLGVFKPLKEKIQKCQDSVTALKLGSCTKAGQRFTMPNGKWAAECYCSLPSDFEPAAYQDRIQFIEADNVVEAVWRLNSGVTEVTKDYVICGSSRFQKK